MKRNKKNLRGATVGPSNGPSSSYRKWPKQAEKNPKFNAVLLDKELMSFVTKQQKNGMESSNPIIRAMYDPNAVDRALEYRFLERISKTYQCITSSYSPALTHAIYLIVAL